MSEEKQCSAFITPSGSYGWAQQYRCNQSVKIEGEELCNRHLAGKKRSEANRAKIEAGYQRGINFADQNRVLEDEIAEINPVLYEGVRTLSSLYGKQWSESHEARNRGLKKILEGLKNT